MNRYIRLFTVFLILNCQNSFGQVVNMPRTISTPYGPATINAWQRVPTYNRFDHVNSIRTFTFTVVLLNDSSFEVTGRINTSDSIHTLKLTRKDGFIVRPSDTKGIYRMENESQIIGVPADSCWLFLVDDKKIRTYSVTSEIDNASISYIQKGESGPILPLTTHNVLVMVEGNEKATKIANKGNLVKAIVKYNSD